METDDIGDLNLPIIGGLADDDNSQINISDVIEVIQTTDPTTAIAMFNQNSSVGNGNGNGGGGGGSGGGGGNNNNGGGHNNMDPSSAPRQSTVNGPTNGMQGSPQQQHHQQQQQQQQLQQQSQHSSSTSSSRNIRRKAYCKITEQPASKALRFRYECEGRSAGSIPGVNSTPENKTFPTIEIVGYKGRAVVVVSCVTKDPPYRPHPHNLVGKEGCKKGVCTLEINSETMRAVFSNLGIQCVKKKDIENALRAREDIRVDPFKTGFQHRFQPSSIDLNSVRLCFQVFLESEQKGRFTVPLPPVVSDPIYDKKAMSDLVICTLCSCSSTVAGGKEIILLCEKVAKEDISVRFFEEHDGQVVWEGFGDFQHTDVHKQTAIKFRTPRYKSLEIDQSIKVSVQLRRPSDGATSEPLPFDYLPLDSGRRSFWSLRNNGLSCKPDFDIFQKILADVNELTKSVESDDNQPKQIIVLDTPTTDEEKPLINDNKNELQTDLQINSESEANKADAQAQLQEANASVASAPANACEIDTIVKECVKEMEIEQEVPQLDTTNNTNIESTTINKQDLPTPNEKITEWIKSSEFERKDSGTDNSNKLGSIGQSISISDDDKTLYDLLEQVAELDEIYTDTKISRETFQNTIANEMSGYDMNDLSKKNTTVEQMDFEEFFDDTATYTSLQKAFKNPIQMADILPPTPPASQLAPEDTNYDPIEILVNPPAPVIDVNSSLKRESVGREDEKLPPLPPKRVKKHEHFENKTINSNQNHQNHQNNTLSTTIPSEQKSRSSSPRPQSSIIIMKTPDQSPPSKKLPPTPDQKHKKTGFFSKLFSRRKSKSDMSEGTGSSPQSKKGTPAQSREPSIAHFDTHDTNRLSTKSVRSLQPSSPGRVKTSKPVGRSVSSVSGKRPHLTPDIVHIPLKGDRGDSSTNSLPMNEAYSNASTITLNNNLDRKTVSALQLADLPLQDGNMELVAIADAQSLRNLCEGEFGVELHPSVDLTEAEHFALYTSIPPQATASEFDETSCYYAPVDAGEILTPAEVAQRLNALNQS